MGNTSTQTVSLPEEKPQSESSRSPHAEPESKTKKTRFSITLVTPVPL